MSCSLFSNGLSFFGQVDESMYWFSLLYRNISTFDGNSYKISNTRPFISNFHPLGWAYWSTMNRCYSSILLSREVMFTSIIIFSQDLFLLFINQVHSLPTCYSVATDVDNTYRTVMDRNTSKFLCKSWVFVIWTQWFIHMSTFSLSEYFLLSGITIHICSLKKFWLTFAKLVLINSL